MKNRPVLFIFGLVVWMGLNWPPDWHDLLFGVLAAGFVAYMMGDMFVGKLHPFKHPVRYVWLARYTVVFIWECIKANIDVAYRVIHPRVPIKPGIVKVRTSLKSDAALTFLANSITLTPGTMTVDVDKKNGFLYIHWINVQDKDVEAATRLIVKKFEDIIKRIFE